MNHQSPFIIFSVFQIENSTTVNLINTQYIRDLLNNIKVKFVEVSGSYNGNKELSFAISAEHKKLAESICRRYLQECYMLVGSDKSTFLVYPNGKQEFIGIFQKVSKINKNDSFTIYNNNYYKAL